MKKLFIICAICILTGCSKTPVSKSPHEILLEIKNYSCKMEISYFSNKNTATYIANQSYSGTGEYLMEFLDNENLKIHYKDSKLNITSKLTEKSLELFAYEEINKNPLFLSYFINTYFNSEESSNMKASNDSIEIILPNNNEYLHSAKLTFNNNQPYSLSYLDLNGNEKVNIIYSEFNF